MNEKALAEIDLDLPSRACLLAGGAPELLLPVGVVFPAIISNTLSMTHIDLIRLYAYCPKWSKSHKFYQYRW